MLRLGLDLNSNSIGWCLVKYSEAHPVGQEIVDIGVRIFADGRDPKSSAPLAGARRKARSARRRRDRYLGRRLAFLDSLVRFGLMPAHSDQRKLIAECDPYALRRRALETKLLPHEIGRVLFHLNQRRGFKSNRKAERQEGDESGKIAMGAERLDAAIEKIEARTLGEFLAMRLNEGKAARVRMDLESQEYDFYPQRDHVEAEFNAIWIAQARYHPHLLTNTARAALHRILFHQRRLREQPVGFCTFITSERRLPKAHPLFQDLRLYEEVNSP
ncbi:MAG: hypothetical protein KDE49_19745 [Novosphingobium sp.]|nr:hypothetical protein [Novosphingobium sp.]